MSLIKTVKLKWQKIWALISIYGGGVRAEEMPNFPLRPAHPPSHPSPPAPTGGTASLLHREVTTLLRQPNPGRPGLQAKSPTPSLRNDAASSRPPSPPLGVVAPCPNNTPPPGTDSRGGRTARCPHAVHGGALQAPGAITPAKEAVSRGARNEGCGPGPGRPLPAPPLALQVPEARRRGSAQGLTERPRAERPLPARPRPRPARRPAAPPPPRALRSRDVRAAGLGTRRVAGRRAETDPGSVRAGSEPETGHRRRPVPVPVRVVALSPRPPHPSLIPPPTPPHRRQVAPPPRTCPRVRTGECPGTPAVGRRRRGPASRSLAPPAWPCFGASSRRPGQTSRLGSSPGDAGGEADDEWARPAAAPGSAGVGLISTGQWESSFKSLLPPGCLRVSSLASR